MSNTTSFLMEEMTKGSKVIIAINPADELIRQFEDKSAKVLLIADDYLQF